MARSRTASPVLRLSSVRQFFQSFRIPHSPFRIWSVPVSPLLLCSSAPWPLCPRSPCSLPDVGSEEVHRIAWEAFWVTSSVVGQGTGEKGKSITRQSVGYEEDPVVSLVSVEGLDR